MKPIFPPLNLLTPLMVMRRQLQTMRLEVGLAAAPDPQHVDHRVRVVVSTNPEWYQDLCSRYTSRRMNKRKRLGHQHHDTAIRRREIMTILDRLCSGRGIASKYAFDLLCIAYAMQKEWEEEYADCS